MKGRAQFAGMRVAVAGTGVSGRAVARAVRACGGEAVVFDQAPGDVPRVMEAVDILEKEGFAVVTSWPGRLEREEWDWVVVSPGIPPGHPVLSDMSGKVMGEVEFAWRVAEAPILAITGTNGKSTTTVMLWKILEAGGYGAALCGNISGSGYREMVLTEAAMMTPADGCLVAEVSSAQLETIVGFAPDVATITNISDDHRDRYPVFEDYRNAKLNLYRNMGSGEVVVLNLDESSVVRGDVGSGARVVGFSPSGLERGEGETRRVGESVFFSGEEVGVADLPFLGEHNVANAMLAWEMAAAYVRGRFGEGPHAGMLRGLMEFRGLDNRMELLGERGGVRVVNNSMCTNPAAVVASSRSLRSKAHLLMGGNTKNMDFSVVREYLRESGQKVYLFGPDPDKLDAMLGGGFPVYESLRSAFLAAAGAALSGETVMLAPGCASAEPYANFRERGSAFREIAKEWLDG